MACLCVFSAFGKCSESRQQMKIKQTANEKKQENSYVEVCVAEVVVDAASC